MNHDDEDKRSTWFVIPYFPGDRGRPTIERPLPPSSNPSVISWLCPAISTNSPPGLFTPGAPLSVTVTVRNYGGGSGIDVANVEVWWADAATGFTSQSPLGNAPVTVPTGGGIATTPPITDVIPATVSPHICLLAKVTGVADPLPPKSSIDPVNNRHWAQLNLNAVKLAWNGTFQFTFWAGNPLAQAGAFDIITRPVVAEALESVARQVRADPAPIDHLPINLQCVDPDLDIDFRRPIEDSRISVEIAPRARRAIHLVGQITGRLDPSRFIAIEVLQVHRGDGDHPYVVGSLGVIVFGENIAKQRRIEG